MASAYAIGYMLAVPVLTDADRPHRRAPHPARRLGRQRPRHHRLRPVRRRPASRRCSSGALAGIGFAGAYMPGLKALTDRLGPGDISRSVTLYTASFSLRRRPVVPGRAACSRAAWAGATPSILTALGPLAMIAACLGLAPCSRRRRRRGLLDFRPVLRNRPALGYILGYGAHCFELYGLRTWIVAFWAFVVARNGGSALLEPDHRQRHRRGPGHAGEHHRQRGGDHAWGGIAPSRW